MPDVAQSPAKLAAEKTQRRIHECIDNRTSFLVEAGAGAGKTYSLIHALNYLVETRGRELLRHHQKVACITYTNVATNEIDNRTDRHPAILASTIHSFLWSVVKGFQAFLRSELPQLPNWGERLQEGGGTGNRQIDYNLGHPKIEDTRVLLHHNDVLSLASKLLEKEKFRRVLADRYPIIFVDEYQDTDRDVANALLQNVLDSRETPLLGFFGDHWQKIYGQGCGKIEHHQLTVINKGANFRSVRTIVDCLNRIRPELTQEVDDVESAGTVAVYHTNAWPATRRTGQHWKGDLPPDLAHAALRMLTQRLEGEHWDFSPATTKILILTHRVLASEQGYKTLSDLYEYNDELIKKEDPYIAFFCDTLEPACVAYENKRFGEMFAALGGRTPAIHNQAEKSNWASDMTALLAIRQSGTVGEVLDQLNATGRPRLPELIQHELRTSKNETRETNGDAPTTLRRLPELRKVKYQEVIALAQFNNEQTPFSTKHGVKGAEFENVVVVFGRGWNQYNFNEFLELASTPTKIPAAKREFFERNRNLFYVTCSRPKKRLALLFTQELSPGALGTLANFFGQNAIRSLDAPG